MELLRKIWSGWKRLGQAIGDLIGRVVLSIFYFTLFAPFGLGVRIWGDALDVKSSKKKGQWLARTTRDRTLDDARRLS